MIDPPALRPTVVLPDTAPLIHLAAIDALHIFTSVGPVVIVDVVALEATYHADKPQAGRIAAWIKDGQRAGANSPVSVVETELGPLYRLALETGMKRPRDAGELAITAWLAEFLPQIGGTALVIYENGKVPLMLQREGIAADIAVATTRNLLVLAEAEGIIQDAEACWAKVIAASPTANPASVRTYIEKTKP